VLLIQYGTQETIAEKVQSIQLCDRQRALPYSPEMKDSAAIAESNALSPQERRKAIIKAYRRA